MLKSCEQCGKRYEIDPLDIKGKSAKFKCKGCGNLVTIEKPKELLQPSETEPWSDSSNSQDFDQAFEQSNDWPEIPEVSEDSASADPGAWQEPLGPDDWPETADSYESMETDETDEMYDVQDSSDLVSDEVVVDGSEMQDPTMDIIAGKPKIKGLSLKFKITLIFVLLVLFSVAAIGLIASFQTHKALAKQAETHLQQVASQKSQEYGQIFNRVKDELEGMAAFAAKTMERDDITTDLGFGSLVYGKDGPAEGQELAELEKKLNSEILKVQRVGVALQSVVEKNPYLSLGYISTDNALTLFSNLGVLEKIRTLKTYHPHKRPWFIGARKSKRTIWTDLYVDAASDELTVTCATPVYLSDRAFKGVIGFDVLLQTIKDDILTLDIGYNSYAFLVNKEGLVLVKPGIEKGDLQWDKAFNSENWLKTDNHERNAIIRDMIRMKAGIGTYDSNEGVNYIAYAPIESMNVSMGIVAFQKDVVKPATDMRNLIILVLAGVLVIAIIIGIVLGNTITRPINKLTVMVDLMSQGQMDLEVLSEDRKDELGVLTKSFNRLIISLKMALSRRG
ncbi:MAG: HAMP domain-containing protein [Desulfobacteraceae bacterium]|nr:MAG: HAMP domain-containing protein [Desulfobacteraceae bacterium]